MLSNTAVKISALTAITLPAVLIGGEIYSAITGQPASLGFIKIYSVLLMIPGMHPIAFVPFSLSEHSLLVNMACLSLYSSIALHHSIFYLHCILCGLLTAFSSSTMS